MRKSSRILHIILTCIISFLVFYYATSNFLDSHFQGLYVIEPPFISFDFIWSNSHILWQ